MPESRDNADESPLDDGTRHGIATDRELYHAAIRAMSEGFVLHAPDGSIQMANPSAQEVLGLTLDQMTGRSAVDPRWRLVRADSRCAR